MPSQYVRPFAYLACEQRPSQDLGLLVRAHAVNFSGNTRAIPVRPVKIGASRGSQRMAIGLALLRL